MVTSFGFSAHPIPQAITLFTLEWPWEAADSVLDAWIRWIPSTPDELWANCQLYSSGSVGGGLVKVTGVFVGSQNFSIESLVYNRELGLITNDPTIVNGVAGVVRDDFAAATPWST